MGNLSKFSIPITIIIASLILGGAFYAVQVSKQNSIEKQQRIELEQKKLEQQEIKESKEKMELNLSSCLETATSDYSDFWNRECKSLGLLSNDCISLTDMTFEEYAKQNNIAEVEEDIDKRLEAIKEFYDKIDECSCRLPTYNADRLDESLEKDKDACFKKYPQR